MKKGLKIALIVVLSAVVLYFVWGSLQSVFQSADWATGKKLLPQALSGTACIAQMEDEQYLLCERVYDLYFQFLMHASPNKAQTPPGGRELLLFTKNGSVLIRENPENPKGAEITITTPEQTRQFSLLLTVKFDSLVDLFNGDGGENIPVEDYHFN